MTVFHAPLHILPNAGLVRRPDLTATEHQAALAGIATIEDADQRRNEARAFAARSHDAQNTQLQTTAHQILGTLTTAETMARTAIDRHIAALAGNSVAKAFISAQRLGTRPWTDTLMAVLSTLLVVAVYMATEIALLGKSVMTSGIFGFLPDSGWDQFFAFAFGGFPFLVAFVKYGWYAALTSSDAREAFRRKAFRRAMFIGLPAWTFAIVFLLGPNLVTGNAVVAADPFAAAQDGWNTAIGGWFADMQSVLQSAAGILPVILLWGIIVGASNFTAILWISHRDAAYRTRREDVRESEIHVFNRTASDALLADQIETDGAIGRLRGLVQEIAHDREAFADQVAHSVESLRAHGEMARRHAILAATGQGQVIDAGPLFARR